MRVRSRADYSAARAQCHGAPRDPVSRSTGGGQPSPSARAQWASRSSLASGCHLDNGPRLRSPSLIWRWAAIFTVGAAARRSGRPLRPNLLRRWAAISTTERVDGASLGGRVPIFAGVGLPSRRYRVRFTHEGRTLTSQSSQALGCHLDSRPSWSTRSAQCRMSQSSQALGCHLDTRTCPDEESPRGSQSQSSQALGCHLDPRIDARARR